MKFRKFLALITTAALLICCAVGAMPASAAEAGQVLAKAYIRTDGVPTHLEDGADLSTGFEFVTNSYLTQAEPCYSLDGVEDHLVRKPSYPVGEDQTVVWYEIVNAGGGWRVHGVVLPTYSVTYDANASDAQGATADGARYHMYSTAYAMENGFTRAGYTFTGWNTAPDGTGTAYQAGNVVNGVDFSTGSVHDVTLYAQWQKTPDSGTGTGETITLGIVTPKRMSVRFGDGTIYSSGDSLRIEIGKTYYFQMCSNNWENDTYDDDGNGLCGTVVYKVRVSDRYDERSYDESTHTFVLPKGDPVLRTDVNSCFMAYRFHFTKGDYNKQTGIEQVVNPPLESLSVNLPLGSTIWADAYIAQQWKDTAPVFIARDEQHPDRSYTDYYWNY